MLMKRNALVLVILLLFCVVAGILFVNFATANPNPFPFGEDVPPDASTEPPTITISNTIVNGNTVTINFKAEVGESTTAFYTSMSKVYYISDWNENPIYLYQFYDPVQQILDVQKRTEYTLSELNVPEGKHTITVYALEEGNYIRQATMHGFSITSYTSVDFTIDTLPPKVLIFTVENRTYETSEIPLDFIINEPVTEVSYSLDRLDNVTVVGNTTLAGLSIGEHSVTVFATDEVGNSGTSETVFFSIAEPPEPLLTTLVIAPIAIMSVIGSGLLVHFKKRKR